MLNAIPLPTGNGTGTPGSFAWFRSTDTVGGVGTNQHLMRFTPTDTIAYSMVLVYVEIIVTAAPIPITTVAISMTAPVAGAIPNAIATGAGSFDIGEVIWSPTHNPFLATTQYTATVTLTSNYNYTFTGLTTSTINGNTATVIDNTAGTVTLSYQFPETGQAAVTATVNGETTGYATLTAALDVISAAPGDYVVMLNADQTLAPRTLSTSGVNITFVGASVERSISLSANGSMFTISNNATLTLGNNITLVGRRFGGNGGVNNNASLIRVNADGSLIMNDGSTITGNTTNSSISGGVTVSGDNSNFIMHGGTITGNTSSTSGNLGSGGGVGVSGNGTFNMYDGIIRNNTAGGGGGGVWISAGATFNMSGTARVQTNFAGNRGGGVNVNGGTFNMSGTAIISNNQHTGTTEGGGGVCVTGGGIFNMSGASQIFGNYANRGGGVWVGITSQVNISGGLITGSDRTSSDPAANTLRIWNPPLTGAAIQNERPENVRYGTFDGSGNFTENGTISTEERTIEVVNGELIRPNGASSAMLELDLFCPCAFDSDYDIDCDCIFDVEPDRDSDVAYEPEPGDTPSVKDGNDNDLPETDEPDLDDNLEPDNDKIPDDDSVVDENQTPDDDPVVDDNPEPGGDPVVDEPLEPDGNIDSEPESEIVESVISAGSLLLPGAGIVGFYHYRKKSKNGVEDTLLLIEIHRERCEQHISNIKKTTRALSEITRSTSRWM
jgi:hypothetical protein